MATAREINKLEKLYEGCKVYHGELHDHSASGGTSDGKLPLQEWVKEMAELNMDFAAILDHRQVRHMYLPEWKDGLFIGGSEPGTRISDSKAEVAEMHYNMLFEGPKELEALLAEFPEYQFSGGEEGHFVYPSFTRERFGELIDAIKAHGGFFVHPHPKQVMKSEDPCDYWFRDETGIEVFYISMDSEATRENYPLWCDLLAAGKRVWVSAGGDEHAHASDKALTTIYAEDKTNAAYLAHLRVGDYTCGPVGIRMCIGDTKTGGKCRFDGQKLTIAVGDFHASVADPGHEYRLDIIDSTGKVVSEQISCSEMNYVTIDIENCAFYRAEVWDVTRDLRISIGNPIWNE
ncbi:MAG: hypothetical protein E7487_09065 [Ruminococcaceae bacterium]|nr:hypothetical protein [Oscillospiraceae bacterium]